MKEEVIILYTLLSLKTYSECRDMGHKITRSSVKFYAQKNLFIY